MKKILWLDTETTGLDPNKNAIIQLAMIMDINGEKVDEIQLNFKPFLNDELIVNEELKITKKWRDFDLGDNTILPATGISAQTLLSYRQPNTTSINAFLNKHISKFDKADKAYVGGYNVPFDIDFLNKFYEKSHDTYLGSYINWKQLDVRSILYMLDYHSAIQLENYKLETACKHFGVELQSHDPMSDIRATREIFYHWRSRNGGNCKNNLQANK